MYSIVCCQDPGKTAGSGVAAGVGLRRREQRREVSAAALVAVKCSDDSFPACISGSSAISNGGKLVTDLTTPLKQTT